jgi:serine O-acetyltransferase
MKWKNLKYLWYTDLYRYEGTSNRKLFLRNFFSNRGFKYTFFLRMCSYFSQSEVWLIKKFFLIPRFFLFHYSAKYSIDISHSTRIGSGFYIAHPFCIAINSKAIIGKNCTLSHQVTIGERKREGKNGSPIIGDNVYIAPGAKVLGPITVGSFVAIGANCVVIEDIPDKAVVVGIPGKVKSTKGSGEFIRNINYDESS